MKILFSTLLFFCALNAQAGDTADSNGRAVLAQVTDSLISQLTVLPEGGMPSLPFPWNKSKIINVLAAVEPRPTESRERDGRPLLFEFDLEQEKIVALKEFFLIYGTIPEGTRLDPAVLRDLEQKILQTIAYLWGADEQEALQQSAEFLAALDRDMVICVADGSGFSGTYDQWREYKNIFVFNRAWQLGVAQFGSDIAHLRSLPAKLEEGIHSQYFQNLHRYGRMRVSFSVSTENPDRQRFTLQNGTYMEYSVRTGEGLQHNFDGSVRSLACGFRFRN